ncbi:MAG TPA: hypothetical protein DD422_06475 [Akkermansia sp.]|nr:hypothetical protein [Akkermansia sp.]
MFFHKPVENGQKILLQIFSPSFQAARTSSTFHQKNKDGKCSVCSGKAVQSAKNFSNQILTSSLFSNIVLYWQVYCFHIVNSGKQASLLFFAHSINKAPI